MTFNEFALNEKRKVNREFRTQNDYLSTLDLSQGSNNYNRTKQQDKKLNANF